MSLLSQPSATEWAELSEQKRTDWLEPLFQARVGIIGGGLAALTAGCFLQKEAVETALIVEAEQLSDRLGRGAGPVGIASPADQILNEIGFEVRGESPAFVDRHRLLHELAASYYRLGGFCLTNATRVDPTERREDTRLLSFYWREESMELDIEEIIGTVPVVEPETPRQEPEAIQDLIVLGTEKREDGMIQAGYQTLTERMRDTEKPLAAPLILSGRKAAELVLDELY